MPTRSDALKSQIGQDLLEKISHISEKQYWQLIESLPFGIFFQCQNKILFANTKLVEMLGLKTSLELVGCSFYDFIHPNYRLSLEECINCLINEGDKSDLLEEKIIKADGTVLDVEIGAMVQDSKDGIVLQVIVKDISERKRTERALEQSEKEFRQLAESMPQFVWTARPDGWISYMNSRWFEYTGQTIEQTQGWGWETVLHPDDLPPCVERWTQALKTGEKYEMEYRYKRGSDGVYRWYLGRAAPVMDETGNIIKWIGTSTDIDDQKKAAEAARQLSQELEHRVSERTAQLELANRELESFSYSVSHDLRAPLRHIVSFVGLLEKHINTFLDDKAKRYIHVITESAQNLQQLVDNLLEFSRMGRADLEKQVVNLNMLIDKAIASMVQDLVDRKIDWQISSLPEVYADPIMLNQVFINLLSNAIKFTRDRELAQISIGAIDNNSDEVIIYIKDNGVGFDMSYADKLFGVFQRLHSKREFEGTGIGLANVQRIVQRHGGRIWTESELQKGATFYFTLTKMKRNKE